MARQDMNGIAQKMRGIALFEEAFKDVLPLRMCPKDTRNLDALTRYIDATEEPTLVMIPPGRIAHVHPVAKLIVKGQVLLEVMALPDSFGVYEVVSGVSRYDKHGTRRPIPLPGWNWHKYNVELADPASFEKIRATAERTLAYKDQLSTAKRGPRADDE